MARLVLSAAFVLTSADNPWTNQDDCGFISNVCSTWLDNANRSICPTSSGPVWLTERMGPFQSDGDFVHRSVNREFKLPTAVRQMLLPPDSTELVLIKHFYGPTDAASRPLLSPPIFIHHLFLFDVSAPLGFILFTGGDNHCLAEEGGSQSYACGSLPAGHGLRLPEVMKVHGDFFDVRPAGAPALEWWVQLTLLVDSGSMDNGGVDGHTSTKGDDMVMESRDGEMRRALNPYTLVSTHAFYNPAKGFLTGPMEVLRHRESFLFYAGRVPRSGEMLFLTLGTHSAYLRTSIFASVAPTDLGLQTTTPRFFGDSSGERATCADAPYAVGENEWYESEVVHRHASHSAPHCLITSARSTLHAVH